MDRAEMLDRLAQLVTEDLIQGAQGEGAERLKNLLLARHLVFPELVLLINRYVEQKVKFADGMDRRELALEKYAGLLRERIRDGILPAASAQDAPLLPIVNTFKPWVSTAEVDYRTTRPVVPLAKSHLNLAALDSGKDSKAKSKFDERKAIDMLEDLDCVECYTPNDRNIGLMIAYEYQEVGHHHEPDFIVRVRGGRLVMLEAKGKGGEFRDEDRVLAKNAAAMKWVAAVNNAGRYGQWAFETRRGLLGLRAALSFRIIENPEPEDRYTQCVPLVSLRAAAGHWSEEQIPVEQVGEWAEDWVTFDTTTKFESGMFVVQVIGDSMDQRYLMDRIACLGRHVPARDRGDGYWYGTLA